MGLAWKALPTAANGAVYADVVTPSFALSAIASVNVASLSGSAFPAP